MNRNTRNTLLALAVIFGLFMALGGNQTGLLGFIMELSPILFLLTVAAGVILRLPKIEGLDHVTPVFQRARVMNWLPLGLTYAFLYMGRYNLKISKFQFENMLAPDGTPMMSNADFSDIFMFGVICYGFSFVINGPLTDRFGGKFSILMGAGGSMMANVLMGLATLSLLQNGPFASIIANNFVLVFSILYCINMYFQSFGAVAIVKVNAPWFHVRERGVFGAIFGILISLGVYFAFDIGYKILEGFGLIWVFFVPAIALGIFWVIDLFMVHNTPGAAGLIDFDTADASSDKNAPELGVLGVFKKMMTNPIILGIAGIEFCTGFLRQAIMQWFRTYAKHTDDILGLKESFIYENWGLLLCCAGILGGIFAGVISDHVFGSRRGPVAAFLYAGMFVCSIILLFTYDTPAVGPLVLFMSMCVIGVHGMLSGTASMDFGGTKNVGVAVGIIDGFVYLGTGLMSLTYGHFLPEEQIDPITEAIIGPTTNPDNWSAWPLAMIPMALIGMVVAYMIRNAIPDKAKAK